MIGSYLLFLGDGPTTDYTSASLVLIGAGFALAHPALNIQGLSGIAADEQGLASGLVGSSFQMGGAIVLAIANAMTLAYTPAHATASQAVHGLHAGMCVAVAGAGLIVVMSAAALLRQRRHATGPRTAGRGAAPLEPRDQAA